MDAKQQNEMVQKLYQTQIPQYNEIFTQLLEAQQRVAESQRGKKCYLIIPNIVSDTALGDVTNQTVNAAGIEQQMRSIQEQLRVCVSDAERLQLQKQLTKLTSQRDSARINNEIDRNQEKLQQQQNEILLKANEFRELFADIHNQFIPTDDVNTTEEYNTEDMHKVITNIVQQRVQFESDLNTIDVAPQISYQQLKQNSDWKVDNDQNLFIQITKIE